MENQPSDTARTSEGYVPIKEASERLKISDKRLYQLVRERNLTTRTIGGRKHLAESDLLLLADRPAGRPPLRTGLDSEAARTGERTRKSVIRKLRRWQGKAGEAIFAKARHGRLRLDSATLNLDPPQCELIRRELDGRDELSWGDVRRLLLRFTQEEDRSHTPTTRVPARLNWSEAGEALGAFGFLLRNQGMLLDQSLLVHGGPGTLKTRLTTTLAVLLATEYSARVLYYSFGNSPERVSRLVEQTISALQHQAPEAAHEAVSVVVQNASTVSSDLNGVPVIEIRGAIATLEELVDDVLNPNDKDSETVAVVIDSLGPLDDLSRNQVGELFQSVHTPGRILIVVTEDSRADPDHSATELCRWAADMDIHLVCALPAEARRGLAQRTLEIVKSRAQPAIIGRHALELQTNGTPCVYPAVNVWDELRSFSSYDSIRQKTLRHRETALPGFEVAGGGLAELHEYLRNRWGVGGALCLKGPVGTFKEILTLHAAANALRNGRSAVLVNLRPHIHRFLRSRIGEYPCLRNAFTSEASGCSSHIEASRNEFRLDTYSAAGVGTRPALYVITLPITMPSEKLLWWLYEGITQSYDRIAPVACVLMMHFSELMSLESFAPAPSFTLMLQQLLSGLDVALLASVDPEAFSRNLTVAGMPDLLAAFDYQLRLEPIDPMEGSVHLARNLELVVQGDGAEKLLRARSSRDAAE